MNIGVVEGFFGPQWSNEARLDYAKFLNSVGANFYIYAPKQDAYLRKKWRDPWSSDYIQNLSLLANTFRDNNVTFGVALSPFGLDKKLTEDDKFILQEKLTLLTTMGVDFLGIFFDDMPSFDYLPEVQIEVVTYISSIFKGEIIFCPTYYTYDPILEKVFGKMPSGYFEKISTGLPTDIEIAWTGPKVISTEISTEHLMEVESLLKRKPFIWENIFANDGPKNCKFLKVKEFSGRAEDIASHCSGMAFNLMNQPYLSQIVFLSAKYVLMNAMNSHEALEKALDEICGAAVAGFIKQHRIRFFEKGIDDLSVEEIADFKFQLSTMDDKVAADINDWLERKYSVGSECLTD